MSDEAKSAPRRAAGVLLLDAADTVVTATMRLKPGDEVVIDGAKVAIAEDVPIGFKLARRDLASGEKIVKWGAPIGSATAAIRAGTIVHVRNMTSDYLPTYTDEEGARFTKRTIS
ncbi:MAG: UxaA family hydrolase [Alphaproteobacteria bacterium]|nr:UxaA family hydrolase [Alphaproteobacteria bacterium]